MLFRSQGFLAVGSLSDHGNVRDKVQVISQNLPRYGFIVDDQRFHLARGHRSIVVRARLAMVINWIESCGCRSWGRAMPCGGTPPERLLLARCREPNPRSAPVLSEV